MSFSVFFANTIGVVVAMALPMRSHHCKSSYTNGSHFPHSVDQAARTSVHVQRTVVRPWWYTCDLGRPSENHDLQNQLWISDPVNWNWYDDPVKKSELLKLLPQHLDNLKRQHYDPNVRCLDGFHFWAVVDEDSNKFGINCHYTCQILHHVIFTASSSTPLVSSESPVPVVTPHHSNQSYLSWEKT